MNCVLISCFFKEIYKLDITEFFLITIIKDKLFVQKIVTIMNKKYILILTCNLFKRYKKTENFIIVY